MLNNDTFYVILKYVRFVDIRNIYLANRNFYNLYNYNKKTITNNMNIEYKKRTKMLYDFYKLIKLYEKEKIIIELCERPIGPYVFDYIKIDNIAIYQDYDFCKKYINKYCTLIDNNYIYAEFIINDKNNDNIKNICFQKYDIKLIMNELPFTNIKDVIIINTIFQ